MKILIHSSKFSGKSPQELAAMATQNVDVARGIIGYISSSMDPQNATYHLLKLFETPSLERMPELKKASIGALQKTIAYGETKTPFLLLELVLKHCDSSDSGSLVTLAFSAKSILVPAIMFMAEGTPIDVIEKIAYEYGLTKTNFSKKSNLQAFIGGMRGANEQLDIKWLNRNSGIVIGRVGLNHNWDSVPIEKMTEAGGDVPDSLLAIMYNPKSVFGDMVLSGHQVPSQLARSVLSKKLEAGTARTPELMIAALTSDAFNSSNHVNATDLDAIFESVMNNPSTSESDRYRLYKMLKTTPEDLFGHYENRCRQGLCRTDKQDIFELMKNDFLSDPGSWDDDSIKALTGNLDFSIPEYDAIFQAVKNHNLESQVDSRFLDFVKEMSSTLAPSSATGVANQWEPDLFASMSLEVALKTVEASTWSDKKKAIMMTYLAVMLGVMTLAGAMSQFRVSGDDLVQNMEVKMEAQVLIEKQKDLDNLKAQIEREIEVAKQRALSAPYSSVPKKPAWYDRAKHNEPVAPERRSPIEPKTKNDEKLAPPPAAPLVPDHKYLVEIRNTLKLIGEDEAIAHKLLEEMKSREFTKNQHKSLKENVNSYDFIKQRFTTQESLRGDFSGIEAVAREQNLNDIQTKLLFVMRIIENGRRGCEFGVDDYNLGSPARRFSPEAVGINVSTPAGKEKWDRLYRAKSLKVQAEYAAGTIVKRLQFDNEGKPILPRLAFRYCPENWKWWTETASKYLVSS